MIRKTNTNTTADTAAGKPKLGRPTKSDRISRLSKFHYKALTGEAGKPLEELTPTELEGLIAAVKKRKRLERHLKANIIVRAYNGFKLTDACLNSIEASTQRDDYRLIIVQSGDDVVGRERGGPDVYVSIGEKQGAVTATNLGLAVAFQFAAPYTIVMDNDTRIPEGDTDWLDRFIGELEQAGEQTACVGATSSKVNVPQHILSVPQTYTADWADKDKGTGGRKANPMAPWFVSFCVLFRTEVLKELGFWDTQYDPGNYEDTDFSVRVREAGYEIRVARSVYIHHDCHGTFKDQMSELLQVNSKKFVRKWGPGKLWDLGVLPDETISSMIETKRQLRI